MMVTSFGGAFPDWVALSAVRNSTSEYFFSALFTMQPHCERESLPLFEQPAMNCCLIFGGKLPCDVGGVCVSVVGTDGITFVGVVVDVVDVLVVGVVCAVVSDFLSSLPPNTPPIARPATTSAITTTAAIA